MVSVNLSEWQYFCPSNFKLLAAQGGGCFYCGGVARFMTPRKRKYDGMRATADHLTPRSKGGVRAFNKVIACLECNQRKADHPPTELDKEKARNLYANCGLPRFGVI